MATDLLMNECGDAAIVNGDLALVSAGDQVKQSWLIHMRTFLGEYFLDASIGIPYIQEVFGKRKTIRELKEIFVAASLQVPGILQVTEITIGEINPVNRTIEIAVTVKIEGNVTGEFAFTGAIPIGGCDPDTTVQQNVGTPWFWFDPTNREKSTYVDPVLTVANAFDNLTGSGTTSDGMLITTAANGINSLRSFDSVVSEIVIGGLFAPRTSMFAPPPAIYKEKLDLWYVLQPPIGQEGAGLLTLNGLDDSADYQGLVVSLSDATGSNYRVRVEYVDDSPQRIIIAEPLGVFISNQIVVLNVTIDRETVGTDLTVTVRADGNLAGAPQVNVGVPEWQSDGRLYLTADVDETSGTPSGRYEGLSGEVLAYRELLTDTERTAVNDTLFAKWKEQ